MARPRVLLTGFGPFPGVSENPSAWLAEAVAARGPDLDCDLHTRVLPTEWDTVAALTPRLFDELQPHVMIHFGVSPRAGRFRLERSAHNGAAPRIDARGAMPTGRVISSQGPERLDTTLPVTALAAHLRGRGLAAEASRSCGRYLCNFLYYRALDWAHRQAHRPRAVFVHMPPGQAQGGPFSAAELLQAANECLRFTLDATAQDDPPLAGARNQNASDPWRAEEAR